MLVVDIIVCVIMLIAVVAGCVLLIPALHDYSKSHKK